jgi:hypothetical protein
MKICKTVKAVADVSSYVKNGVSTRIMGGAFAIVSPPINPNYFKCHPNALTDR